MTRMVSFMVDVFFINGIVLLACSFLSSYFGYLLLLIPVFAAMKLKDIWDGLFGKPAKKKK
ncbi:hypothetical protein HDV03_001118 [Kappamyces sp. JEL0829]|nr:hypothetical protein HDV03_001118 [Kappamyces sp. JEL0829]